MLIVPAIDIMGGKVVRLEMGDFNRVRGYGLSPVEFAKKWQAEGASIIHVVDLDGAKTGEPKNFDVISEIINSVTVGVEVGGGIRNEDTVKRYLSAGAERVVLSTKVIEDPGFLLSKAMAGYLGQVAISIDIKHMESPEVVTSATAGWLQSGDVLIDIPSFMQSMCSVGVRFVNFSDISRDGMMIGPDAAKILNFMKRSRKSCGKTDLFFTYAGGISCLDDIKVLNRLGTDGVDALIVGRALYENKFSLKEAIELVKE